MGLCPQQFYRHIHAIIRSRQIFNLFIYSIKTMLYLSADLATELYHSIFSFQEFLLASSKQRASENFNVWYGLKHNFVRTNG